ncbi:MAG: outer membrane beta-barrel protein [Fibrobacter sp.]|uniref:outer membrane beta-barrel protein n=1 Tax=Fibrobacter sp. TaxID=35828 RepID=UPI0025B8B9B4|nr:outer membrane beta-barrel protein [Fibrobacter sp.]MBQ9225343.1 outer membrane beta-barrel protein [Fibrobacter sp.]
MKAVRICIFALLFASIAFAEGAAQDKSHYFGGRFAFGFDYVWDNAPVRGTFGSAKDGVGEAALGNFAGLGIEIGASYMYRLNGFVGFVGEAEFSMAWFRLDEDVYGIPPEDPYGDQMNFGLYVYRFAFPVLVRVVPISKFYLEAGAQFNLNVDGDIASIEDDVDESFGFDVEPLGWSLAFGGGFNIGWDCFLGMRFVMDMTRIEKDGIVEMTKGAAYREASPMKLWSLQFSFTGYFL